jgi:glutamate-1-semialdehyde 2,1-aminomutase
MQVVCDRLAVHAGTFNGNAIACVAARTVLTELKRDNCAAVSRINEMGEQLMKGIGDSARRHNQTVRIQGPGALFCVSFHDREIFDMRDAFVDTGEKYLIFRQLLLDRGIHIFPTEKGLWYISAAHTADDIEETLRVVDDVFGIMDAEGV